MDGWMDVAVVCRCSFCFCLGFDGVKRVLLIKGI